ncbi:MAG: glycosyltransferase family 25 protein [Bacteroidetes bacterium]|nr:glycosyltransferase family 25 protein [Bacteroidota bacterium]
MKSFVINLSTAPQRKANAINECWREGIQPEFFVGINNNIHGFGRNLPYISNGAIGCFISHYMLMQQLVYRSEDMFLIMEDDIKLPRAFNSIIYNKLAQVPSDWDVLFCGWMLQNNGFIIAHSKDAEWIKVKGGLGMHAYIVRKRSLEKILSELHVMRNHIDIQLAQAIENGRLNGYWLKGNIVSVNAFPSQIPK